MKEADLVTDEAVDDEKPPVLGSWRNIYLVVLVFHLLLLIAFYLFSRTFSV